MNAPASTVHGPARPRTGRLARIARAARAARPGALRTTVRGAVRRPSRSALVKDVVLYAILALPVASGGITPPDPGRASWWLQTAGLGVLAAAIAVCRTWPTVALLTAIALISVDDNFTFAMPVLAYLTGLRTTRAQPLLWGFAAVSLGGAALAIIRGMDVTSWFPSTVWLVLLGVLPWLVGRYWRQYQELLHAGWERAERLEHEQRITAERERLRERARIAQDMHDSLGHELALIAVRAGALQVDPGLGDRHRDAAAQLRAGAADATEHLREIIGVLREDAAPAPDGGAPDGGLPGGGAPIRPAGESIPELVERARASGVPVHLADDPDPADPPDLPGLPGDLPPMVALAAHRVVQEAVTNAAKHAPGAAVTVRLTHREPGHDDDTGRETGGGVITVTVANDPPPGEPPLLPSGGHGLTGLTERARLLGGTLHAGPTPQGGFTVTAVLPTTPPATHPAAPPAAGAALRKALGLPGTGTGTGEWSSESARHLARERRQVRRGLITAIAVPAALMAALGAIMAGYYIYSTLNSVLPPADYAALRLGAAQTDVEDDLPRMEAMGSGVVESTVPEPAHADCRYYRPDANLIGVNRYYRLCFTDGRLTRKDSYDTTQLSAENRDAAPGAVDTDDADRRKDTE
ncbi:sensor histidine kinase [Actinomadura sp. 9N215]|uniref:sensor histidine kinase n=1 Tax=Actinomadura sp. 9N215 TaxID=3375150 RepID=UPI003793DE84